MPYIDDLFEEETSSDKLCIVAGCGALAIIRHLCSKHYQQYRREGLVLPPTLGKSRGANHYCYSGGLKSLKTADDALVRSTKDQQIMLDKLVNRSLLDVKTECWEWRGYKDDCGYAKTGSMRVSRLIYVIVNQAALGDLNALHTCDNPGCINPNHIFAGTQAVNIEDMHAKGRHVQACGEAFTHSKLDESKVREMHRLRMEGMTFASIAVRFDVSKQAAMAAVKGDNWGHVR